MSNNKRSTVSVSAVVASVEAVAVVVVSVVWLGCDIACRSRIAVFIAYKRCKTSTAQKQSHSNRHPAVELAVLSQHSTPPTAIGGLIDCLSHSNQHRPHERACCANCLTPRPRFHPKDRPHLRHTMLPSSGQSYCDSMASLTSRALLAAFRPTSRALRLGSPSTGVGTSFTGV